jgi:2-alkyl-3-oxoalkanoate reductase
VNPDSPRIALTGATGFIGRHLVRELARSGVHLRLLLRRDPRGEDWGEAVPEVVAGDLRDARALEQLVDGADAVIHLGGLIKAATRRAFFEVNVDASAALAQAVRDRAPHAHVLHVSSLAAREPQLSDYAASKRAGEDAVLQVLGERVTVLRPPAVYGPGDRETLVFFQLARQRRVPLLGPPEARAAMIHVDDLCRLIALQVRQPPRAAVMTAADARPDGYGWQEVMQTAAAAVGNAEARLFQAPASLLRTIALAGDLGRRLGAANMLNSQKLRELQHRDWSVPEAERAQVPGWAPRFDLAHGFADAVRGYRAAGWLPR